MSASSAELHARSAMSSNIDADEKLKRIAQSLVELARAVAEIQLELTRLKGR
jgi:hypothetical protein